MNIKVVWNTPEPQKLLLSLLRESYGTSEHYKQDYMHPNEIGIFLSDLTEGKCEELHLIYVCLKFEGFFFDKKNHPRIKTAMLMSHKQQCVVTPDGSLVISDSLYGWKEMLSCFKRINIKHYKSEMVLDICQNLYDICPLVFSKEMEEM